MGLGIPSLKLTWHLKIHPWKRRFLLETIIFGCYVSFREGIPPGSLTVRWAYDALIDYEIWHPPARPERGTWSEPWAMKIASLGWCLMYGKESCWQMLIGDLFGISYFFLHFIKQNQWNLRHKHRGVMWIYTTTDAFFVRILVVEIWRERKSFAPRNGGLHPCRNGVIWWSKNDEILLRESPKSPGVYYRDHYKWSDVGPL